MRTEARIGLTLLAMAASLGIAPSAGGAMDGARVFARVPDPGSVALTTVGRDGMVYGGSYFPLAGNGGDGVKSRLFKWSATGTLLKSWEVEGQDLSADHGIQAATIDAAGMVYLLDTAPARVLRFDPVSGSQSTYATVPRLPTCAAAGPGQACKDALLDSAPELDYAAWGPDGSLYLTDAGQASIFRVPPEGGHAQLWLTDPHLDGGLFGPTGLALAPDHRHLLVSVVASRTALDPAAGSLVEVPIQPDGSAGAIRTIWTSGPLEAPDGFAIARSGNVYMALLGPLTNQLVELSPTGQELQRYPSVAQNAALEVPFDAPSSAVFDGTRLLVTNNSFYANDRSHQVIFSVDTGEVGMESIVPPARVVEARLVVQVSPRSIVARRLAIVRISVRLLREDHRRLPPRSTRIQVGGRRYRLTASGVRRVRLRVRQPGTIRVVATAPGVKSASARLQVRP